jgi:endonuclease G
MAVLLDFPEDDDSVAQRLATQSALSRGDPGGAATPHQRAARSEYIKDHWPVLADEVIPEGYVGKDDTLWSSFLIRGARCAEAVGRVVAKGEPAESRWRGTAFLISDWVAVTNQHVIETPEQAAESAIEFRYEFDQDGDERRAEVYDLDPERLFFSDRRGVETDYAVVAVKARREGVAPGKNRGPLRLIAERGKAQNGDPLNLIHHPSGLRKRITVRENRLLSTDEFTLHYSGDTLGGSSGAPVFNDQWEVVGVHFGGKPKLDEHKRRLTAGGEVWDAGMSQELIAYEYNVGARVSSLIRDWRARAPDLTDGARRLLFEAIGESS